MEIFIVSWNWGAELKISGALMESPQKLHGARAILSKVEYETGRLSCHTDAHTSKYYYYFKYRKKSLGVA